MLHKYSHDPTEIVNQPYIGLTKYSSAEATDVFPVSDKVCLKPAGNIKQTPNMPRLIDHTFSYRCQCQDALNYIASGRMLHTQPRAIVPHCLRSSKMQTCHGTMAMRAWFWLAGQSQAWWSVLRCCTQHCNVQSCLCTHMLLV